LVAGDIDSRPFVNGGIVGGTTPTSVAVMSWRLTASALMAYLVRRVAMAVTSRNPVGALAGSDCCICTFVAGSPVCLNGTFGLARADRDLLVSEIRRG